MTNLYEALEICLHDIEQGLDIETTLLRYPDLADELRPILEASVDAGNIAIAPPPPHVVQRNRAKVLQHAAQMREAKARSSGRIWFASLRRLVVTLAVVAMLFISGTGLVRAASTTLPGDNLYPVKRTWEDVLLAFTFNMQQRDALEVEHENERLQELQELFAEGRSAEVDFAGSVTSQTGSEWIVSNITVIVSPHTEIRGGSITVGSAVRVKGQTQSNNAVIAEKIESLPASAKLPDIKDEPEIESNNHEGPNGQNEGNSGEGSEEDSQIVEETKTPEPKIESENRGSGSELNNNSNSGSEDSSNNDNTNDTGSDDHSGSNSGGSNDDSSHDSGNHDSGVDSGGGGGSNIGSESSGGGGGGD